MKRILLAFLASLSVAYADPQLTSWFTANSGKYARIYQSTANETTALILRGNSARCCEITSHSVN